MARRLPLIVVLGATACGKTKLSIELARRFGGEIISADSMQVYHGLDIVTNKVTEEEQNQAKHHMLNFLEPNTRFSVVDFRDQSLNIISNLLEEKKLPIIVGGTNYYIESLIWKGFLLASYPESNKRAIECLEEDVNICPNNPESSGTLIDKEMTLLTKLPKSSLHNEEDLTSVEKFFAKPIFNDAFKDVESNKLWKILEQVDEKSAHFYPPNDKRRIIRCLQIIQDKRRNYSDILKDVNISANNEDKSLGGPLRYENTCVFWLNCDNETLHRIQDQRVDRMLDRGLLAELENFHESYNRQRVIDGQRPDYTKGIFQTIGFKEFHEYLMLPADIKATDEGNLILKKSIQDLKISTRRYAKRQLKWIRSRFMQQGTRDLPALFKLEVSTCFQDDNAWANLIRDPAFKIVESFLQASGGGSLNLSDELMRLKQEPTVQRPPNEPGKLHCEICDRTFVGSRIIEEHLNSKNHHRKVAKKRIKELEFENRKTSTMPITEEI